MKPRLWCYGYRVVQMEQQVSNIGSIRYTNLGFSKDCLLPHRGWDMNNWQLFQFYMNYNSLGKCYHCQKLCTFILFLLPFLQNNSKMDFIFMNMLFNVLSFFHLEQDVAWFLIGDIFFLGDQNCHKNPIFD